MEIDRHTRRHRQKNAGRERVRVSEEGLSKGGKLTEEELVFTQCWAAEDEARKKRNDKKLIRQEKHLQHQQIENIHEDT